MVVGILVFVFLVLEVFLVFVFLVLVFLLLLIAGVLYGASKTYHQDMPSFRVCKSSASWKP